MTTTGSATFHYARIERPDDIPPAHRSIIDVAVLDMNHGWPNLGHDSIVHAVEEVTAPYREHLRENGCAVRVLSYDVRRHLVVPEAPGGRFRLYVGTGGPGHIDPRRNGRDEEGSQGLDENAAWEKPLFLLFDAIVRHRAARLLAVCHTFGVLCRWSGVAVPTLRSEAKGGKSSGVVDNVLTEDAVSHPWFSQLASRLPEKRRLRVIDNRLFDLIPVSNHFPAGVTPIAYETDRRTGEAGEAVTMIEFARETGQPLPRVFGVNHHPEIYDRERLLAILREKEDREDLPHRWYEERAETLQELYPDAYGDRRARVTTEYTFLRPLETHIRELIDERIGTSTSSAALV